MALTINPAVSGSRRHWFAHIVAFAIGAWLGGLLSLAVVIVIIDELRRVAGTSMVAVCVLGLISWTVAKDLGIPLWVPYRQRQVPEWLRDALPPGAIALLYGSMLGVGFLTLFTYSTQLAFLLALPFLSEGPWKSWRLRCQALSWRKEMLLRWPDRGSTPMNCASVRSVSTSSRIVRSRTSPRTWASTRKRYGSGCARPRLTAVSGAIC